LAFLAAALLIYALDSVRALMLALALSSLLFFLLRTPRNYLKGLLYANAFTLLVIAGLLFTDPIAHLRTAAVIFLKANALLLLTFALVLPAGLLELLRTLEGLGLPKRLVLLALLSYRYLTTLRDEYEKLKRAAACRGFEPSPSLRTYRTYGYLLGALTAKSLLKAKEVYKAMTLRGLEG